MVGSAVDELVAHGIVHRLVEEDTIRYQVAAESQLAAAYYRNMVIHFFVDGAVAELALAGFGGAEPVSPAALLTEARRIRDLLIFEFFFAGRDAYGEVIAGELDDRIAEWRARLDSGDVAAVQEAFRPFRSPAVLRPFIDAYRLVAGIIADDAYLGTIDESGLVDRALKAAPAQVASGTIASGQSVSKILFETAVTLARHRGVLEAGPDVVERRKGFAAELDELATRIRRLAASNRSNQTTD